MNGERALTVLLIGNYEIDQQESMQRFANVLAENLPRQGVAVEVCRPTPFFGLLRPSASGIGKWLGYLDKFLLFPVRLTRRMRECKKRHGGNSDRLIIHICDHSNAFYTRYLRGVGHLVTCNDMLAIRSAKAEIRQNPTRWSGRILQAMILRGLNRAHTIACISEATRRDVLRLSTQSSNRVRVVHMGQNHQYKPVPRLEAQEISWEILRGERGSISSPAGFSYLLHVGGNQWYKNRLGVLKIYATLRERAQLAEGICLPKLVMVGPDVSNPVREFIKNTSVLMGEVIFLRGVNNEALGALYSTAELLLFPSVEEGFGWPIIEAQACGCRVVTTGKPPMTEIGGEGPAYINPAWLDDDEGIRLAADTVWDVLDEGSERRKWRVEAGLRNAALFSTEKMIDEYITLYREIVG